MDSKTKSYLKVLGLSQERLPKMKEVRKQYIKLSLLRHPDKKLTGSDELFNELGFAYEFIGNLIQNSVNTEIDEEEEQARKEFRESNLEKVNKTSVTIKIKTEHVKAWWKVFEEKYGSPIDISEAQSTKQWKVPYKLDEESFGVIKVKIWDLAHKEKSTMLIQGEHMKQYLNISFAEKVIPKLFNEVLENMSKRLGSDNSSPKKRNIKRACKKCPQTFNSVSELNQHILNLHELNFNSCKECGIKFTNLELLKSHIRQHHEGFALLETSRNEVESPELEEVSSVRKTEAVSVLQPNCRLIKCNKCDKSFRTKHELKQHDKAEHVKVLEMCAVCDKDFACEDQLNEHMEMQHVQERRMNESVAVINELVKDICDMCEESVNSDEKLQEHTVIEHEVSEHSIFLKSCQICSIEFNCEDKLNQHEETHDLPEEIEELCDKCGERFIDEEIFREHIRTEHTIINKNCDNQLRRQVESNHANKNKNIERCEHCENKEDEIVKLRRELKLSKEEAKDLANVVSEKETVIDSKCKEVEKLKRSLEKLEKEKVKKIKDQKEELQESYKKVDKYVDENTVLKEEIRTLRKLKKATDNLAKSSIENNTNNHSDEVDEITDHSINLEDDYVANFYWEQNKNRYKRTGPVFSAEAPVDMNKCDVCQKSFRTLENLRTHKRTEHIETPRFKCDRCGFVTKTLVQLKEHKEVRHGNKNIVCRFWKQSRCRKQNDCAYLHPEKSQPCRLKLECHYWPNCKFSHDENIMCKFQMNCRIPECGYQHPTKIAKPCHFQNNCWNFQCKFIHFEERNVNPFLGKSRQFSPPDPTEFPPLVNQSVWRPW